MNEPRLKFRQPWRLVWRLPLFLVHVIVGIPLTLICFIPGIGRFPLGSMTLRQRAHQTWKRVLLKIFGIRLQVEGELPGGPCLVVANHITWLDIVLLHALWPMWLVAKAEIERWPLIGVLARLAGTIFIVRGSVESRRRVARRMSALLKRGDRVGIFPEGGIRRERGVKVFHAPLFGPAIRIGVPVVPVAIRFQRDGSHDLHDTMVFGPGENFLVNMLRVMAEPPLTARLSIGPALTDFEGGRRNLSRRAHAIVKEFHDD